MEIEKTQYKDNFKHICKNCNFYSNNKNDFNRHISTAKHKKRVFGNKNEFLEIKKLICECCSKEYKTKSGLWKHHKACNKNIIIHNIKNNNLENLVVKLITDNNDIKNTLLKENQELKKKLNDKDNQINDLIPRIGNTTNNTINNNKFNITVFLNEKCKDAMSINEFVKSIEISLKNLITTKTKGLGIGINEIITENMNKLSLYERPIHCTDKKRETLYVKNDTWTKDTYRNSTSGMLKAVQLKQIKNLHKWIEEHPNYLENEDLKHEYTLLINKCTKPLSEHEKKLFKNICDNTYVKDENLIE